MADRLKEFDDDNGEECRGKLRQAPNAWSLRGSQYADNDEELPRWNCLHCPFAFISKPTTGSEDRTKALRRIYAVLHGHMKAAHP